MSRPSCDACTELRERAPEFVMNGVTDNVANSLINNRGVSWNSNNCDDLQDVNDCLIGRKVQEIESFDVCDWKEFMSGLGGNLYETLKAMIMNECGLRADLCQSTRDLLYIIAGGSAKKHYMTPTASFRQKWKVTAPGYPGGVDDIFPVVEAQRDVFYACGGGTPLHKFSVGIAAKWNGEWGGAWEHAVTDPQVGDVLGYINKSELVPNDMTDAYYNDRARGWDTFKFGGVSGNNGTIISDIHVRLRAYTVYAGVELNTDIRDEYGPDVMVMEISGFTNGALSGTHIAGNYGRTLYAY